MLLQGVDIQDVAQCHVSRCFLVEKSNNFLCRNMDFSSCNIFVYFPFYVPFAKVIGIFYKYKYSEKVVILRLVKKQ